MKTEHFHSAVGTAFTIVTMCLASASAHASDEHTGSDTSAHISEEQTDPVKSVHASDAHTGSAGIGVLYGESNGATEAGVVLGGSAIQVENNDRGPLSQYRNGNLRLEVGTGFGISAQGHYGFNLIPTDGENGAHAHIGIEPFNLQFSANTDDDREDFIEYSPMGSAGLRVVGDTWKALLLARGGGSFGTLGQNGVRPAVGGGLYVNTENTAFSGELTRIFTGETEAVDIANANLDFRVNGGLAVGLRGEMISTRSEKNPPVLPVAEGDRLEARGFVTAGTAF